MKQKRTINELEPEIREYYLKHKNNLDLEFMFKIQEQKELRRKLEEHILLNTLRTANLRVLLEDILHTLKVLLEIQGTMSSVVRHLKRKTNADNFFRVIKAIGITKITTLN
ncbi:MAG: hypothetical protein GY730_07675 [bacterium]|nr:hypothetical protein [bacterium]